MRTSGILMPMSSLPSRYGIGSLGREAYEFVDFLHTAGQTWWQLLPIGPTSYGDSPYQSFSAFACNPYFIDLDILVSEKLLTQEEAAAEAKRDTPGTVDYLSLFENRYVVLRKAVERMDYSEEGYATFKAENAWWLEEYAMFMAIKATQGMRAFWEWPIQLRLRNERALEEMRRSLSAEIEFWEALQYLFHKQWKNLKQYANKKGVRLMGDMPIYVSPDSVEFWSEKRLFQVDGDGEMLRLAGCPPDAFSKKGQLWGNPLYDWKYHQSTNFKWWIERLRYAGQLFDAIRIDHFRGFASYYSVPAGSEDAVNGRWEKGPGRALIDAIKKQLPDLYVVAEDLGFQTDDVKSLLAYSGFPGMKVLQFAFDSREKSDYLPHNYGCNSVVYTGTHDNTTTADWEITAPAQDVSFAREYLGLGQNIDCTEALIRAAMGSVCRMAVIPMQDWLGLGVEARMNIPSTVGGNWLWRIKSPQLTSGLAEKILRMTTIYGRKSD